MSMQDATRALQAAIAAGGGVLICGEHGTGRVLFARAIHLAAHDGAYDGSVERLLRDAMRPISSTRPFIVVDCSVGADVEERLFGVAGDDAEPLVRVAAGSALDQANGGTLLLACVTDLPRRVQARLSRALRDGEIALEGNGARVSPRAIRLRMMATIEPRESEAVHDLVEPDLFKRLSRTTIELPCLRDRREDIPGLVQYLLALLCVRLDVPPKKASTQALELLAALQWRGNVAELRALLAALVGKVPGRLIRLRDVLGHVRLDGHSGAFAHGGTLREARDRFEREYVAYVLQKHHGRMADAAKALGLQRTNLYRKVRQLSLRRRRPGSALET